MKNLSIAVLLLAVAALGVHALQPRDQLATAVAKGTASANRPMAAADRPASPSSPASGPVAPPEGARQQAVRSDNQAIAVVPASVLRHLVFNAVADDFTLTQQFADALAATPDELRILNGALQRAGRSLQELRDASTIIVANDADIMQARVTDNPRAAESVRQAMLSEAERGVPHGVYTVFAAMVDRELGRRFAEYGKEPLAYTITKRVGKDGSDVFVVESAQQFSHESRTRILSKNEYSREQLVSRYPLASRLRIAGN